MKEASSEPEGHIQGQSTFIGGTNKLIRLTVAPEPDRESKGTPMEPEGGSGRNPPLIIYKIQLNHPIKDRAWSLSVSK